MTGTLYTHRQQCAAFGATGCLSVLYYDSPSKDPDTELLTRVKWQLDHGLWVCPEHPVRAAERPTRPHLTAFGTVDRDYNTGEAVKITMPSGHILTLDPEQPPIYAAEHLHAGQRVAWATWLAGNAVVGAE